MARFPMLHTVTYYGIARVRVLVTCRSTWTVLIIGCVLVLAVMGTSAARRARTGGTEDGATVSAIQAPVVDNTVSETVLPPHSEALDVATASSSPVQAAPAASPAALPDTLHSSVSTTAMREERAQCAEQQSSATERRLAVAQPTMEVVTQHQGRASVRKARRPLASSSRTRKTEIVTPPPTVTIISVSSTAALIQRGHWRQMIQRGTRLNGWTVTRLTPTGLTLRRGRHQAVVPLSFAVRSTSAR
jgi:hypothetical protein